MTAEDVAGAICIAPAPDVVVAIVLICVAVVGV